MSTPTTHQAEAIERVREILGEHFDCHILVAVAADQPDPYVSALGHPVTLLGCLKVGEMFVSRHQAKSTETKP